MSFKDLKAKRDSRRVTAVTVSLAQPTQDPQRVSNTSLKGFDDLQDAWTLYKDLPPNVKIQETVERGRGLWATESISAGAVHRIEVPLLMRVYLIKYAGAIIISTRPHVYALSIRYLPSHCSSCTSEAGTRCGQCRTVHYCSAK